ncbi:MAG TPA: 23S rRNA (uracil(1939)-C(5))-methyltransferase RlmD, partial [Sellimonas intestinalis]|nr:23S rRNA (uracil(1939)-C(5))-methyltransferase RlmD [Sellimonas intestinalis]
MKKNDFITLEIEDIGVGGEGIGKAEGVTFFVKDAIVGDVIEARITKLKKHYGYARLMKILKPSGKRKEAKCPVARQCGGCQIQEMDYGEQLKFKERKVRNNLERIGGFDRAFLGRVMEPICSMEEPFHYRNKAQYPIGTDREGYPVAGFYAGRTHQIIPNMVCALGKEINTQVLEVVLDFMREFQIPAYSEETGRGLLRHVLIRTGFHTGEIMVCFIVNGTRIPHTDELTGRLRKLPGMTSITMNINCDNTNVIMGKEIRLLWGKEYITDYIGEIKYQISPLSFYQVNPVQTEVLYGLACEYAGLTGNE